MTGRRFPMGQLVATPAALAAFAATGEHPLTFVTRHLRGDWGDLDRHDTRMNELALTSGARLLSAYHLTDRTKVWIITEADRSVTTVLLPSDY